MQVISKENTEESDSNSSFILHGVTLEGGKYYEGALRLSSEVQTKISIAHFTWVSKKQNGGESESGVSDVLLPVYGDRTRADLL